MNAWTPRLAMSLAAFAALTFLAPAARAQQDTKKKQEILLGELPPRTVSDAPFTLIAKATSGLPVAFEVIDGPAVMDGKKLRLTGSPGLVIVRASQDGNAIFAPASSAERVFTVHARPFPPSIEIQPLPASAAIGEPLTLSAAAKGEPLPSYQWRRDGIAVAGAVSARLTIPNLTSQDAGTYDLVVTNDVGSATTLPVRVSVGKRHQSIMFPSQPVVQAGQSVSLTATATSGLPIQYRVISGSAILSSNTITLQQGNVMVEADQRGDSNYEAAAPVIQSFSTMPNATGTQTP